MKNVKLDWTPLNTLEDVEREAIKQALIHHEGCLERAAEDLDMGRTTLYRRMPLLFSSEEIAALRPKKHWYD